MLKTPAALREIAAKVSEGRRLSRAEGIQLYKSPDLLAIGQMADLVRARKHGRRTYFILNRHINHTNVCVSRCKLCAFGRDADSPGAYTMSLEQIEERAARSAGQNIAEIHVVGGLNPDLKLDYYVEMMRRLRRTLPGVIIQSLTAVEIDFLAREHGLTHREVLAALQEAGLDSLPGGGAEVFSPRVREIICPEKVDGETWLAVHQAAHELGIRTNATMLYGHVETIEERIDHLLRLRELQDRTGGFLTIIPLAFHPKNTDLEPLI
ncbi:MAG: CofH family radical SAM protein, partial [Firmicutes bacterium]|nr:CofH family radical SAM protein [Bacillota bacterium]